MVDGIQLFECRLSSDFVNMLHLVRVVRRVAYREIFWWTDNKSAAREFLFMDVSKLFVVNVVTLCHCFNNGRVTSQDDANEGHPLAWLLLILERLCQNDKILHVTLLLEETKGNAVGHAAIEEFHAIEFHYA